MATAFVALVLGLTALNGSPFDDRPFSESTWAAYDHSSAYDSPRGQMYDDLTRHYLKPGMSMAAVVALLGEPDLGKTATHFSYSLGAWSAWRMDYNSLEIQFNKAGSVTSVSCAEH